MDFEKRSAGGKRANLENCTKSGGLKSALSHPINPPKNSGRRPGFFAREVGDFVQQKSGSSVCREETELRKVDVKGQTEGGWAQGGPNMGPIWAPAKIGQKTTSFTQSKICAKLMINKRKVLEISGSYGWT